VRWLAVTAVLLTASAALVAGIFLRDRDASWRPPPRMAADYDAGRVLTYVAGPDCGRRCSYRLLANPRDGHWLARIVDRSRTECVDINLDKFDINQSQGIAGIALINCASAGAAGT
jgi:hypothetical protein